MLLPTAGVVDPSARECLEEEEMRAAGGTFSVGADKGVTGSASIAWGPCVAAVPSEDAAMANLNVRTYWTCIGHTVYRICRLLMPPTNFFQVLGAVMALFIIVLVSALVL
jgi:hypothetical protein